MANYPFEIVDILAVNRDANTGAVTLQTGDVLHQRVIDNNCPLWDSAGLRSIPAVPVPNAKKACQAVALKTVDADIVIATRDLRASAIEGLLKPSETCVYATTGQAASYYKLDGSVIDYTTDDNTATGHGVFQGVAPNGLIFDSPYGKRTFGARGYHLTTASGARIDVGGLSAPGVPPALNSYVALSAQSLRLEGAAISLGTVAGTPEPVAKATTLLSVLGALQAVIDLLAASTTGLVAGANPVTLTPGSPLASAITAAHSAITAAAATLPSITTTVT